MAKFAPPMSNLERQRLFRQRHPGYYRKYSQQNSASMKAANARHRAMRLAEAQAKAELQVAQVQPLMLPAPAETIEIPGMNVIPASRAEIRDEIPVIGRLEVEKGIEAHQQGLLFE